MKSSHLTVIVLTMNEVQHIERCYRSAARVADRIVVVDSGSTDGTRELARALGATVLEHPFVNHADQFTWAVSQLDGAAWILRLDADEYLSPELTAEIQDRLPRVDADVDGISVKRRIV